MIKCDLKNREHRIFKLKGYEAIPRINFAADQMGGKIYVFGGKLTNEDIYFNELLEIDM
jgi:hypothetical protein